MSNEPLPGEQLVATLFSLMDRLNKSGVQRTYGLREAMGVECEYYWKSLRVFIKRDYNDIRDLVEEAKKWFDAVEEESSDGKEEGTT